uniref:Tc1-like transposase DDE domain-containing protein n=1 Tax=Mycena chlorophos TaxID=658473 RepID=A0ABQ0L747_MYCCL|nr:predicted protein [Mycena chlorophos]
MADVLHDRANWSFEAIAKLTPFKNIKARTIANNYHIVKDHGGDFYYSGRKENSGRKRHIDDVQLAVAMFLHVQHGRLCPSQEAQSAAPQPRAAQGNDRKTRPRSTLRHLTEGVGIHRHLAHGRANVKINLWGALGPDGPSKLVRIPGTLNAEKYVAILEDAMVPLYDHYENRSHEFLIFQQDNDPKHRSKRAKGWFRDWQIEVMEWPAYSPDLSPIENAWAELKRRARRDRRYHQMRTESELWALLQEIWYSASFRRFCIKTYRSFPKRLRLCEANNFAWVKY